MCGLSRQVVSHGSGLSRQVSMNQVMLATWIACFSMFRIQVGSLFVSQVYLLPVIVRMPKLKRQRKTPTLMGYALGWGSHV